MKIPKFLFKSFRTKVAKLPNIDDYLDAPAGVWCLGYIPSNLKFQVGAQLRYDSKQMLPFSEAFLREVVKDDEGFQRAKFALQLFIYFADQIIGGKSSGPIGPVDPWCMVLCISRDLEVNASAHLTSDGDAATVVITINAGVFVTLAHRLLAMFADESFMQNLGVAPIRKSGSTTKKTPDDGSWCAQMPNNANLQMVAAWTTALAAIQVLQHELAHFFRGHLALILARNPQRPEDCKLLEIDNELRPPLIDPDTRRCLELDADEAAGTTYATVMRIFDHPVPGPEDGKIERFYVLTILAAVSTFIIFEEGSPSRNYYPPAWRVHQFFGSFINEFFSQALDDNDDNATWKILEDVMSHVEARYSDLNWGDGFDLQAASASTNELLSKDLPKRVALAKDFSQYMPHICAPELGRRY